MAGPGPRAAISKRVRLLASAVILLMLAAAARAQAPALVGKHFTAKVVRIADGDSLEAVPEGEARTIRVRLEGIDAPEVGEAFSREAQSFLRGLVFDKRVRVIGRDVDRYGRLVARIEVAGRDASVEMLTAGLACQRFATDALLAAAEARARAAGVGFWAAAAAKPQCVASASRPARALTPRARADSTAPAPPPAQRGPLRGNVSSLLYHRSSCPNFTCRNCTRLFASESEARAAGFRPAGDCAQ